MTVECCQGGVTFILRVFELGPDNGGLTERTRRVSFGALGSHPSKRPPPAARQTHMNAFFKGMLGALVGTLVATGGAQWGAGTQAPLKYRTFNSGVHSNIQHSGLRVLNNDAEFQSYWAQLTGSAANAPRGIEWGKELLIAINLGTRSSGGYQVYVERIDRPKPNDIVVHYVESQPAPGSVNTAVMTSPWVLVRMDRAGGNIQFQGRVTKSRVIQIAPPAKCGCTCGCGCCR